MSKRPLRKETLLVGSEGVGARLDRMLVDSLVGASRKAIKRALDGGQVFLNGRVERRANLLLQGGELITLTWEGEAARLPLPELEILYRDEHLLAINKPAALPAHPTVDGRANALDLVRELLQGERPPILLHRLDADTTGVLLFALTAAANRELSRQFAEREVRKTYLALVAGTPPDDFTVDNYLKSGVRGRTVVVHSGGDRAQTAFRTLTLSSGFALVEAVPKTGRTHQIRVHLADAGYPLLGDALYGGPQTILLQGEPLHLRRHLLHALNLSFPHPHSHQSLTIQAQVPADFLRLWPGLLSPPVF